MNKPAPDFQENKAPSNKKKLGIKTISIILAAAILLSAAGMGLCALFSGRKDSKSAKADDYVQTAPGTLVGKFTDRKIEDADEAILAVQDVAKDLGFTNATDELSVVSTNTVDELTYYRLQQNYQGIPVYGSTFVVVADENGEAKGLSSNVSDVDTNISLEPTVTQER